MAHANIWRRFKTWSAFLRWHWQGKPPVPAWAVEQRGERTIYTGFFAIYGSLGFPRLCVRGRVVEWPSFPTDVYLYDPPVALRRHPHGSCLQLLKPGEAWFKLHWQKPARDFAQTCAYLELLLDEVS